MIPIHVNSKNNILYVAYLNDVGDKQYKIINDFKYELFVSDINTPIIDINKTVKLTYSTEHEKNHIIDIIKQKGLTDYLSDLSPWRQYYLKTFNNLNELPNYKPKIAFIDIEVLIEGKIVIDGSFPITIITVGDYINKKMVTFGWHCKIKEQLEDIKSGLFLYNNEQDMIDSFLAYMNKEKFDIITGWNFCEGENGSGFDNPYIVNRLKRFNRETQLSPFGIVEKQYRTDDYEIFGLPSLDYLTVYRKFKFKELPTYNLNSVAEEEGISTKVEFEGSLNDLYKNDFYTYIKYNRRDVKIMMDLENKYKYFDLITEIRNMSFVNYNIINNSTIIDNILIKHLRDKEKVAISRVYNENGHIPGAYVKEPKIGMYNWVVDLDYTSLYPFIIMNMNISPDTKQGIVFNWNEINKYIPSLTDDNNDAINIIDKTKEIKVSYNKKIYILKYNEFKSFLEINNLIVSNYGILFDKTNKGIFPEILEWIFEQRKQYKNMMIEANKNNDDVNKNLYFNKQLAFKILLNSFYGFVSFAGSRFYDTDLGSSVTMTGRKLIRYAIQKATDRGYFVITTDTDSILFTHPDGFIDETDAIQHGSQLSNDIDNELVNWCKDQFNIDNSTFNIKQEIVARRGVFFAKKRYSLWKTNQEGATIDEVEYKGIDIVRNSTPPVIRKWLEDIFESALKIEDSKNIVYEKIINYKDKLKQLPSDDIGIRCSLTKDIYNGYTKNLPIHVRGALLYEVINNGNISFESEMKGRYYFLKEDASILTEIKQNKEASNLLLGDGKSKSSVITIPNNSTFALNKECIDYIMMEERLLNKPLKHLVNVYEMQDIYKFIQDHKSVGECEVFNLLYDKIKYKNIQYDAKILKKYKNKNFSEKYYDLSNIFVILDQMGHNKERFIQFLINKI